MNEIFFAKKSKYYKSNSGNVALNYELFKEHGRRSKIIDQIRNYDNNISDELRDTLINENFLFVTANKMDLNIHKQVIENGDPETGCTIHYVTETLDSGPIIIQKKCCVSLDETPLSLKKKVQTLEGIAFIEAIKIYKKELIKNENL